MPHPADPASILAGLAHAVAGLYALASQMLDPDWEDWTPDERATAIGDTVGHLRILAHPLESLHPEAATLALEQALTLARLDHTADGVVGKALAVARSGAILGRWLHSLAGLTGLEPHTGPLTLGELFQRIHRGPPAARPRLALENQTRRRALETSARTLAATANQLADQALGLLWLHGTLEGQKPSELRETAETLFTQAGSVLVCAAGLLSADPYGVPETDDDQSEQHDGSGDASAATAQPTEEDEVRQPAA